MVCGGCVVCGVGGCVVLLTAVDIGVSILDDIVGKR